MLRVMVSYASGRPSLFLRVPDMGLSPREWAAAVFTATNVPSTNQYGVPGAREVAAALESEGVLGHGHVALAAGDWITVAGMDVRCVAVDERGVDAWGVGTPTFGEATPVRVPHGPLLYVSADAPPPEALAYAEDDRDRLWTGRGAGEWRCLTDPAGRTAPALWASVWRDHGPLTPLVPVELLAEPDTDGGLPGRAAGEVALGTWH